MEEEELDEIVVPDQNDELLIIMRQFVDHYLYMDKFLNQLTPIMFSRYQNVHAFDNSKKVMRGIIEYALPSPHCEQMKLIREKFRKKLSKITGELKEELENARRNYRTITNMVTRILMSLRKQYGDDLPPPIKTPSSKTSNKSSKITPVTIVKDKDIDYDDDKEAKEIIAKQINFNDNGEIDEPLELPEEIVRSKPIFQMYGQRHEQIHASDVPLQDLYETKAVDIFPIPPFIQDFKDLTVFDPCCGNKAFGHVLMANGFSQIIERDLFTQDEKFDYLTAEDPNYSLLITNPPFQNKVKFIKKAYESGKPFILLLPFECLTYKEAKKLFKEYGVKVVVLHDDPVFLHQGKDISPLCCSYFMGNFPEIAQGTTTIVYL